MTDVEEALAPLSARSVMLSMLLGSHPDRMSAAELVRAGEHFGIPAATSRVALTRAVAAGDLQRDAGDYVLGERLAARQRRQDEAVLDAETGWDGTWEMAVVVVAGRTGAERAALRDRLASYRLAELREGVWTRPANLRRPKGYADEEVLSTFAVRPDEDAAALAARLWDLDSWAHQGRALLTRLAATTDPALRLAVAAHVVRHLAADPLLPAALLPGDWPATAMRTAYAGYQDELRSLSVGVGAASDVR
ncbi:PaaX family transcriptional regulator C-terminal domain-containing protein [Pimelobacter simplex]|uniref:PaaX family transcriptional regulator C-terminal domain-containing protein n=1 Tax=Nocardioides simplex TaxID=2045 RepID=UPI00214F6346|nr:PaaX family transcriptional regulator C-terminal domain-containing protein [Pimelobacter simplex]UUW91350.1 PaaX domain-containing protein, C- domain protein [Pimelobacter simplex]UUW95178.1 PaaX domain-containing protein, C- domain protein [Pimelobacter simplex]